MFRADNIRPPFVRRWLAEEEDESVPAAFLLQGELPNYWLDFLLRRHKGRDDREHYPTPTIVA